MKIDLTGKTAIVTGSTQGIGFASAAGLAAAGARTIITGRSEDSVNDALTRLKQAVPGAVAEGLAVDLATAEGCNTLVKSFPDPDILVNNVGIFGGKPFFEIEDQDWDKFFQTNVMSGVRLSRAYLQGMIDRGWGRVVFISSESAINIPADMIHYGFTKTAMLSLSRGLAKLATGSGVTVNSVLPGPTQTAGVETMLQEQVEQSGKSFAEVGAEFVKSERPSSLLGRLAQPEEVANLVVYTCSPQASATTGAALRGEGGIVETIT